MLKNKYLRLSLMAALALVVTNAINVTNISSKITIINNLKISNKSKINKTVTNNKYGMLGNGSIIGMQDKNEIYHFFDIKEIINNPKLKVYAKEITIDNINYRLTYDTDKISYDVIDIFSKAIAAANYNEEQLTSTSDLQIFDKQNLSKISTTAYKSNKAVIKKFMFVQFGGANIHLTLNGTRGIVDNIINYDNLSETLGLYYIAKSHPRNSRAVCLDFVHQFVSKSSLKTNKNDNQFYENILNNIIDSTNLEFFIQNSPIKNDSKDMSIRYLLDGSDNVVSVGYLQYDSNDLVANNNLILNHSFPQDGSVFTEYDSTVMPLLKWSDYTDSWENFTFLYPLIFADTNDNISYNVMNKLTIIKSENLRFSTKKIQNKNHKLPIWRTVNQPPAKQHQSQGLLIYIFIWYDENWIYQKLTSSSISRAFDVQPSFSINISKWTVSNFINIISI